ncbi:MAG: hypothetical protein QOH39_2586 [Verrucomicrobiota bacterium]|jgi:exopolysaccharide biosynthesis polyprenyl glycosylphosphotransferase
MIDPHMNRADPAFATQREDFVPTGSPITSKPIEAGRVARQRRRATIITQEWAPTLLLLLLDILVWTLIYGGATSLRHEVFEPTAFESVIINLLQIGVLIGALYTIGGYDRHNEMRGLSYTTEHVLAVAASLIFSSFLIYSLATFAHSMKPSRGVLLVSFVLFAPISLVYRRWIRASVATTTAGKTYLVIGAGEAAANFYEAYQHSPNAQQLCFVDPLGDRIGQLLAGEGSPMVQGNLQAALSAPGSNYSGIILAEKIKRLPADLLEGLVRAQFHTTRVYTMESFYETHWRYVPLEVMDPVWPLQTGFQLARISPYHYLKRLFDVAVSGALLVICSPLMGFIACLVWLTSGRPAIYFQTRMGRENHPFTVYKFRTMILRPPEEDEDIYTRKDDPRVTRTGRWLRKLRLDELPQLWNVFRGDMSLIGPRAEWIKCADRYEKKIPLYHFRHLVKPGITGWAQVNYPYGESEKDAIEKLKYDLYYIRHYSLKLDAMIVLKTVHTMLFGKGR